MTLAESYAKALHSLVSVAPERQKEHLSGLQEALRRRGHLKLLPRIYKAYEILELRQKRGALHAQITPEKERNRILLELYHTLIHSDFK